MSAVDYSKIDSNRPASYRQFNGVAYHFAQLHTNGDKSKTYMATRMFKAILYRFYTEQDIQMTHGEAQKFFKAKRVPAQFKKLITIRK